MKNYYTEWSDLDHKRGFKVTITKFRDYDSNYKNSYPVLKASYQPKGYWGSGAISVSISKEGVDFQRSSGGDIKGSEGADKIKVFMACLEHAQNLIKDNDFLLEEKIK